MIDRSVLSLSRRRLLQSVGAAAMCGGVGAGLAASQHGVYLEALQGRVPLVGDGHGVGATDVWCYNGDVPGPVLRFRQGSRAR
ncbi:MAG: multicopper oxidase family protein, partial [Alphaproteobacteria bacterium]|nr:multicopper oxidase family protein [Alphaproteobacteria bacterium]